jgi:hypothetical protein
MRVGETAARMTPLIPDGKISRAIREGLILRKRLIADGLSPYEADQIVGQGLKGAWAHGERTEPWHSVCERCKDSGWIIVKPSYMEQKRLQRLYGDDPQHQDYMQACDPCRWREQEREKRRQLSGDFEGLAAAGQTKRLTRKY